MSDQNETSAWVTVLAVTLDADAQLIVAQLELKGFEVQILDEYGTQTGLSMIPMSQGARIQVRQPDWEEARAYLLQMGYLKDAPKAKPWVARFMSITDKIPGLNKLHLQARLFTVAAIVAACIIVPFAIQDSIPPSMEEQLSFDWCVTSVEYNGKQLDPIPTSIQYTINGCSQSLNLKYHETRLPNFGDAHAKGIWTLRNSQLIIRPKNGWEYGKHNVFYNTFDVYLNKNSLTLKSDSTTIKLYKIMY